MRVISLALMMSLLTSVVMAQSPTITKVSEVSGNANLSTSDPKTSPSTQAQLDKIAELRKEIEDLENELAKPKVTKGLLRHICYPNRCQMSYQSFHKMMNSLGIIIATTDKDGNLCAVTPVTITTFPPRQGFVLEIIENDPRTKLEIKPGYLGYNQSQQILACYGIETNGSIYHLYPKSLECQMASLRDSKYYRDTFWRPSLRCRNVIGVSYGFYRPCFLSNNWSIYVKSLTYR
jgi:hypothetical protein